MISPTDILHGRILIVDDQHANVALLERMLRRAGYDSIASTMDSGKVCELHLLNHYDLILLDLEMPGIDGFQVMENLKEIETGGYLPVLVVTAQPNHKLRALKAGAKDFVSKPFDLAEVLIRVHNMLEVRLMHLELKKLYDRVVAEQKISQRLLRGAALHPASEGAAGSPGSEPDASAEIMAESHAEVAVLFADIMEFTKFSESASADVLASVLDDISGRFDSAAGIPGIDRAKTVGDAYLAAAGLPGPLVDRTIRAAHLGLNLIEAVDRLNAHSRFKLKVRLSIDANAAATGGIKRKTLHDL